MDGSRFANTKQHVAGRQSEGGPTELFTNTKLNIALINDPKNGPRFTMTKRESGLDEQGDGEKASEAAEKPADETAAGTTPEAAQPCQAEEPPQASTAPVSTITC